MLKFIRLSTIATLLSLTLTGCVLEEENQDEDLSSITQDNLTPSTNALSTTSTSNLITDPIEDDATTCQLTVLDEAILELINEARSLAKMCGDIVYESTPPVTSNCALKEAATAHALDMGENNFFSHTGSDGLRINHRVDEVGYDWLIVGENIAVGQHTAQQVMEAWLASPEHCATIMNKDFEQTATAVHLPQGSDYSIYWALVMAKSAPI